jgi:antitoxin MazE
MKTRVQKWGNSLAVRIPKPFAEGAGFEESTQIEVSLEKGGIRLAPIHLRKSLSELLSKVTKRNLHGEIKSGPAVGREVW